MGIGRSVLRDSVMVLCCAAGGAAAVFPGADWEPARPAADGFQAERVQAAASWLSAALHDWGGAGTLFIVRHGRVVWAGPQCAAEHAIFSATKSFTSTCFGLLIEDGKASLSTLARDHQPALAAQYPDVTLRHFATMTSGYDAATVHYETDAAGRGDSWIPDPPAAPLFAPGTRFRYWDEAMMQFGNILARLAGEPLDLLFKRRVADRIGMTRWRWDAGQWTGGIHTSSRELARFGHLFLNRGNWHGGQLVPAAWVDEATAVQVPTTIPNDDLPRSRGSGIYGYNWWVNGLKPDGTRLWPDAPPRAYYANGLHSNVCIVVPEWGVVVTRTNGGRPDGSANTPADIDRIWSAFLGQLGSAFAQS
ncbi:MAG: beta-lactamase family protein [Armatimonadetes bacterium]|nr:beta-lactamase family protein [Armatimonadota bacterium]